jgi:orotidine-5'-phosphate decarboxylase
MPHTMILVPGYGAQGGDADSAAVNFDDKGRGAIVNASRSLLCAYKKRSDLKPEDFQKAAYDEAVRMRDDLNRAIERNRT